jgi:hypothetical protein
MAIAAGDHHCLAVKDNGTVVAWGVANPVGQRPDELGVPIHLVQAPLGHASVATTGPYLHARPTESSAKYLAV